MAMPMAGWVMALRASRDSSSAKATAARAGRSIGPVGGHDAPAEALDQRLVGRPARRHHVPGDLVGVDEHRPALDQQVGHGRLARPDPPGEADGQHQAARPAGSAGHGEEDQGGVVELLGDEPVVGGDPRHPAAVVPGHQLVGHRQQPGVGPDVPRRGASGGAGRARRARRSWFALTRRAAKSAFTWGAASTPPSHTSSKWRPSMAASSARSKRWRWKGFSKSAGSLGVSTNAAPSSLSTRAISATWPSGSVKCSIRCDEHTPSKLAVRQPQAACVHLPHLEALGAVAGRCRGRPPRRSSRPPPPGDRHRGSGPTRSPARIPRRGRAPVRCARAPPGSPPRAAPAASPGSRPAVAARPSDGPSCWWPPTLPSHDPSRGAWAAYTTRRPFHPPS